MASIDTISKLLAQAENAEAIGNKEEARAFNKKVAQLCASTGISEAEVRENMTADEKLNTMEVRRITVGDAGSRGLRSRAASLAHIVDDMLVMKSDLAFNGTQIVCYGVSSQIDQAEQLVAGLLAQNESGIPQAKKEVKASGERFNRVRYDQGFFSEMRKLAYSSKDNRQEIISTHTPDDDVNESDYTYMNTQAIALRNMELETVDYYAKTSNAKGTYKGSRSSVAGWASFNQGKKVGKGSNLSGQLALSA